MDYRAAGGVVVTVAIVALDEGSDELNKLWEIFSLKRCASIDAAV